MDLVTVYGFMTAAANEKKNGKKKKIKKENGKKDKNKNMKK